MPRTLVQLLQAASRRLSLKELPVIISSQDKLAKNLLEAANEEGRELRQFPWQVLKGTATFNTIAAQIQGNIETIAPGFNYIVNNTIWNRTLRRPVYGPNSPQAWAEKQAMRINGPFNSFRIMGGNIVFYPTPAAGQECVFEYMRKDFVSSVSGASHDFFQADDDTILFDEELFIKGVIWRWRLMRGFDATAEFDKYSVYRLSLEERDGGKASLDMSGGTRDILPGIFVPAGNWGA